MTTELKTSKWFVSTVAYGNATSKKREKVTYCVEAQTFSECEHSVRKHLDGVPVVDVLTAAIAPFKDVALGPEQGRFYKVTVKYTVVDENTGKEKRTKQVCLIQATDIEDARTRADTALSGTGDYEIASVVETAIYDVFTK